MAIQQADVPTNARSSWESFLHRPPLALDRDKVSPALTGKRILITGAGGWIGSALTRAVAEFAPGHLVLLEAAERNLYELEIALLPSASSSRRTYVMGSVTDPILLEEIFSRYQPELVFHTAAFKHVPVMEQNPFAAIQNNAIGTARLVQAAVEHATEKLILVSTDKAVDPVSIMGASKRIAELILMAMRGRGTRLMSVRMGNVFGSEGSIVPLFRKQIESGASVTLTHPQVRRYFVTTADAVILLLTAASIENAPDILVPELGEAVLVREVAEYLIAQNSTAAKPSIVLTGLRPGDKMAETLLSERESYANGANSSLRPVVSPALGSEELNEVLQELQQACQERSLKKLLAAVNRAVPEYQPSAVIEAALAAELGTRA